jgi:nucleoside-diphosphate-sugar epimerase
MSGIPEDKDGRTQGGIWHSALLPFLCQSGGRLPVGVNASTLPSGFRTVEELEAFLSRPTPELVQAVDQLAGDIMILGVGGKMGPTLAMLACRAVAAAHADKRVIGVSRFSDPQVADKLRRAGVEVVACDLMDREALGSLPDVPNIIYMVGFKFGATGQEARTWAVNAFLPGLVAQRFPGTRMVLFSSGNVYPFTPVALGHCTEEVPPGPIGEYAQSVLGRERIFAHFAQQGGVSAVVLRLNYAVEVRYGVLLDIARRVWAGEPIRVDMGHVNLIWQGDANAYALRCLALASRPPLILNVTGPETLSVRSLAHQFGKLMGRTPAFEGSEQPDALLSNAQRAFSLLGYPHVPLGKVIEWVASWVVQGGPVLDKPTKFQVRDGRF